MSEHQCKIFTKLHEKRDYHDLFRDAETGQVLTYTELPPGALYEDIYPEQAGYGVSSNRPDDKTWTVKLPCGTPWFIDRQASNGGGYWTRQGEAPAFTVSPSIHITTTRFLYNDPSDENKPTGKTTATVYHGWLTGGKLISTADSPC